MKKSLWPALVLCCLAMQGSSAVWTTSNPGPFLDYPMAMALSGSDVYLAGYAMNGSFINEGRVERRDLATAALVTAFDGDGALAISSTSQNIMLTQVLAASGALYVVVQNLGNLSSQVQKRNPVSGVLDPLFGAGGAIDYSVADGDRAGRVQSDGSFLYIAGVTGPNGNYTALLEKRSLATGALVAGFGAGGKVLVNASANNDAFIDLAFDGASLYASGYYNALSYASSANTAMVEKRDSSVGAADPGFGTLGRVLGAPSSWPRLLVHPDGLSLIGTEVSGGADTQWEVDRLDKASGLPLAGFAAAGRYLLNPGAFGDSPMALASDAGSLYVTGVEFTSGTDAQWRALKLSLASGAPDPGFYTGGHWTLNPTALAEMATDLFVNGSDLYVCGVESLGGLDMRWRVERLNALPPASPTFSPTLNGTLTATPTPSHSPTPAPPASASPTVTQSATYSASPTPVVNSLPEAVDNLALSFALGGNANWFYQTLTTFSGGDAAESGNIADGQSTWMEASFTGPGVVSFYWSVSSESGWDFLRLALDGADQGGAISGTVGWTQRSLVIPAGIHTVRWTYSKDGTVTVGGDAGWVDLVAFTAGTLTFTPTRSISATFTASRTASLTRTISSTLTASLTATTTRTVSATLTASPTRTPSPSVTATLTPCALGTVLAPPVNEGFESGILPCYWTTASTGTGRIVVASTNGPFAGTYHLLMDSSVDGSYGLNEAVLRVDLSLMFSANLSFRVVAFGDEIEALPATYAGSFNGDGVSISQDGVNWVRLWQGNSPGAYTLQSFDLLAAATAAGFSNLSDLRIKFQQYDNFRIATDGYGWDEISITGLSGTATISPTHTVSGTVSPTFSISPSFSVSPSSSATRTPSPTRTATPSFSASPTVAPTSLPEAVDNYALSFTLGGSANWFYQTAATYSGGDAAESGNIGDSQLSWMETTVNGPGTLSFYWSVSSETGWDFLSLLLDGIDQGGAISGTVGWTQRTLAIPAGAHTVRWSYSKDSTLSFGADAGRVDLIVFSPIGSPTASPSVTQTRTLSPTPTISATFTISPTHTASPAIAALRPGKIFSYPNPFSPGSGRKVTFVFDPSAQAALEVYDWAARKVGDVQAVFPSAGYAEWDGRLSNGKTAATGVYFCVLKGSQGDKYCKFTVR